MKAYIRRRLVQVFPVILGVALITFLVFHVAGGDPVLQMVGPQTSPDEIETLRHQYGLDQPLTIQFFRYLGQLATGDFERSFQTKQKVTTMLASGVGASLWLTLPAFIASSLLAIALALIAAVNRGRWLDRMLVVGSTLGMSISILAFILLGQYLLAFKWGWFPISGYEASFPKQISYLLLPWLIWVALAVGGDVRFFRTVFLEEMHKDYVRTARAKGVGVRALYFKHVLRNAMVPIISRLVIEIPFLFMGSLLLENFFGIPGLGSLLVEALNNSDWPVIKAVTFLGALFFVGFNLLSDLLYAWFDPRVVLK